MPTGQDLTIPTGIPDDRGPTIDMDYMLKHPLQTLLTALGAIAIAAATSLARHSELASALILGALGTLILVVSGWMMLRTPDWGTTEEWGAVAIDRRQRLNLLIVALGTLLVGETLMWIGFGPGKLFAQLLLVGGGWLIFVCGVVALATWLQARRLFG